MIPNNTIGEYNDSFTFYGPVDLIFDKNTKMWNSFEVKLTVSVILIIIMVMSIVGNICTSIVILNNKTMRTATNVYLLNLAVTDLLMSLLIPVEVYILWLPAYYPFSETGCQMHLFSEQGLFNASLLTIMTITVERYLVITRPFMRQKLTETSRVYKIIGIIWIVSILFCFPEVMTSEVTIPDKKTYIFCYTTLSEVLSIFIGFQTLIFYMIPMVMIALLYTIMAMKLKTVKMKRSPGKKNREKAVKMLAMITGSFFFCWTPLMTVKIMTVFKKFRYEEYYDTWRAVFYLSTINGFLSNIVNPILYSLLSRKFRQAFKELIWRQETKSKTPNVNS